MTSLSEIRRAVAPAFGITVEDLRGPKRVRKYTMARRAYCKLARCMTDQSTTAIAKGMGKSDHTTVLHHLNAEDWKGYEDEYERAQARLTAFDWSEKAASFQSRRV